MSTIAKFLPKPPDQFSTQISSSTVAADALTVSLDSISGLPTEGVGQFFKKDSQGNLVSGSVEFVHWTNATGNTLTFSDTGDRGITGSDSGAQAYVADDYFEVWVSSYYVGGYGGVVEHNSTGTHTNALVTTLKATGAVVDTGTSDVTIVTPKAIADSAITTSTKTQALTNKTITPVALINTVVSYTPSASGTATLDLTTANIHKITMPAGNITIAISNEVTGQCFLVEITQDATGSRTVTWFSTIKWAGGSAPTLTTTASKRDVFGFRVTGTDTYDAFIVGQNV